MKAMNKKNKKIFVIFVLGILGIFLIGGSFATPPTQINVNRNNAVSVTEKSTSSVDTSKNTKSTSPSNENSITYCDTTTHCPEGSECYSFRDEEKPICWEGDPCEKCSSKKCRIAESYPMQVFCEEEEKVACDTSILCAPGYVPYDTGRVDSQGCPIKKCVKEGNTWQIASSHNGVRVIRISPRAKISFRNFSRERVKKVLAKIKTQKGYQGITLQRINGKVQLRVGNVSATTFREVEIDNEELYLNTPKGRKLVKIMPNVAAQRAIEIASLHYIGGVELKEVGDGKPIYEINGSRIVYIHKNFPVNLSIKIEVETENGTVEKIFNKNKWIKLRYENIPKNISENLTKRIINRVVVMKIARIQAMNAKKMEINDAEISEKLRSINKSIDWGKELIPMNPGFKKRILFILKNSTEEEKNKLKLQAHNYVKSLKTKKKLRIMNKLRAKRSNFSRIREMLRNNVMNTGEILQNISQKLGN
jgi:hypothetical protein